MPQAYLNLYCRAYLQVRPNALNEPTFNEDIRYDLMIGIDNGASLQNGVSVQSVKDLIKDTSGIEIMYLR